MIAWCERDKKESWDEFYLFNATTHVIFDCLFLSNNSTVKSCLKFIQRWRDFYCMIDKEVFFSIYSHNVYIHFYIPKDIFHVPLFYCHSFIHSLFWHFGNLSILLLPHEYVYFWNDFLDIMNTFTKYQRELFILFSFYSLFLLLAE